MFIAICLGVFCTLLILGIAFWPKRTQSRYISSKRVQRAYAKVAEIKYKVQKEKNKKVVNLVAIRRWEAELKKPAKILYKVRGDNYAIR